MIDTDEYANLRAERDAALTDAKSADEVRSAYSAENLRLARRADDLQKECDELRSALLWYARCDIAAKAVSEGSYCRMEHDDGRRAREAIGNIAVRARMRRNRT